MANASLGAALGEMGPGLGIGKQPVFGSVSFPVCPEFGKEPGRKNGIAVL